MYSDQNGKQNDQNAPGSGSKKLYYIIGGVVAGMILLAVIVGVSLSVSTRSGGQENVPTTTTTQSSVEAKPIRPPSFTVRNAFKEISANMDPSVDPCDDFYEYACGSFKKRYPVLKNKSEVNYFTMHSEKVYRVVTDRLEGNELYRNPIKPLVYTKSIWDSCVHDTSNTSHQMTKLKTYFEELDQLDSWLSKFIKLTRDGYNVLMTLEPGLNNLVYVSLGPSKFEFKGVHSTDDSSPLLEYYTDLIQLYKPESEREELVKLAREMIEFENWMSTNATSSLEEKTKLNLVAVAYLGNMTGKMDWRNTFKAIFDVHNRTVKNKYSLTIIDDLKYVKNFRKLVDSKDEAFLGEYFKLAVTRESCFFMGQECRDLHFRMASTLEKFESKKDYEQKKCFNTLNKYLNDALFKVYDPTFDSFASIHAKNFSANVATTMANFVKNITWMDKWTRDKVFGRLVGEYGFKVQMPYELESKLEFEKRFLDAAYINSTEKIEIFDHFIGLIKFDKRRQAQRISRLVEWSISLFETHPIWSVKEGHFYIPDYFVRGPFASEEMPGQIKFGFLGSMLAHEITHQFDARGGNYSKLVYWDEDNFLDEDKIWSYWTEEQFDSRMRCLIDSYDGEGTASGKINGSSTLDENLADLFGLNVAYASYKNNSWSSPLNATFLPAPLRDMIDDRLFFLSYANTHCSNDVNQVTDELARQAPRKYRVNLPLAHTEKFAQAFECKAGSRMNPVKKCPFM